MTAPPFAAEPPHPEYEKAMADLERRAACGTLTLAQARQEIFALRERFLGDWAQPARVGSPGGASASH